MNANRFYWDEEDPKKSRRERRREREELKNRREREEPGKSRRERRLEREKKTRKAGVAELILTAVVAFVLVFGFVRPYVVEAYRIPTESMVPTLEVGDRVLANKFVYRFTEPERRDIVVFDSIDEDDDQTLIKRVVGVAGDEIQVQSGVLYVNGEEQEEPYLNNTDQSQASPDRRWCPKATSSSWATTGATRPTRASSAPCPWRTSRARPSCASGPSPK